MKIGIISFYSDNLNRGAENWAFELSKQLEKNHSVKIFKNQERDFDWNKPSSKGILRRFFLDYWSIAIAKFTLSLWLILWKENFDIVIPTNGGWQTFFIRIFTWFKGSKMVVVGHSGKGWDDRVNLWCFSDCFIALTNYAKNWAKKVNPLIKVEHIPNGVDLSRFKPIGQKLQTKLKNPIILCVGALVKSKRVDLTIKAVSLLNKISLLVVGKGEEEERLRELGKKLLGERFQLINLPFNKMPECYRTADVFTLTSWESEASPLVYLEAMASNLAVVATNDSVRNEIIGEAGILVDPKNTAAYAKSLEEVLERSWQNIPRHQAEKFSWDKITDKYEKVMVDLVK